MGEVVQAGGGSGPGPSGSGAWPPPAQVVAIRVLPPPVGRPKPMMYVSTSRLTLNRLAAMSAGFPPQVSSPSVMMSSVTFLQPNRLSSAAATGRQESYQVRKLAIDEPIGVPPDATSGFSISCLSGRTPLPFRVSLK